MPSDPKYTQAQVDFASELAKKTGVDFYTVFGWEIAEGGPSDNPLNIGPGDHFGTPVKAADVTAQIIQTSKDYTDILQSFQTKYPSEDAEIAAQAKAIAYNEHWNVIDPKTHTAAQIAALRKQYYSNISAGALQALYEGVQPNSTISQLPGGGQGIQNPPDNPGGLIGGIASALNWPSDIAGAIEFPFKWLAANWERVFLVLGGAIILIIAIVLVGLSAKSNVMSVERGDG